MMQKPMHSQPEEKSSTQRQEPRLVYKFEEVTYRLKEDSLNPVRKYKPPYFDHKRTPSITFFQGNSSLKLPLKKRAGFLAELDSVKVKVLVVSNPSQDREVSRRPSQDLSLTHSHNTVSTSLPQLKSSKASVNNSFGLATTNLSNVSSSSPRLSKSSHRN